MNKSCPTFLLRRAAVLLLCGAIPLSLRAQIDSTQSTRSQVDSANLSRAQVDSTRSSRVHVDSTNSAKVEADRRQNYWLSAGIGVGAGGVAVAGNGWYSNNHLVVGAQAAQVSALWGPEVHDYALLFGLRNLNPHSMILIAAGPARLAGKLYVGNLYIPRAVANYEVGFALSAQARVNFSEVGIGLDAFLAQSENRLVKAVTLSLQAGWLGN
jgi:hypothetical protein